MKPQGKKPRNDGYKSRQKNKGRKFQKELKDDKDINKVREGKNDVSWYGSSEMIAAAARLNFTNPLGKPVGYAFMPNPDMVWSTAKAGRESLPGVMAIGIAPLPGVCQSQVDAINIFSRNFYSWIRHENSGHANYDAPDMCQYLLAVDAVHYMLEHLIRAYGVARTASVMNRFMPDVLLRAMGIYPTTTLYENLADVRARILQLMVKAGTLCVPKDIKLNERHREMFKYLYSDGTTTKAQTYLFVPSVTHVYDEPNARLVATSVPTNSDIYTWLGFISNMLDMIIGSESMNIMSGDILKVYGADGVYHMDYFGEDYTVLPVYNPEILLEIHNAKCCGVPFEPGALDIYQNDARTYLMCTPYFKQLHPCGPIYPIIDIPVEVPTPENIMVATRLTNVGLAGRINPTDDFVKYTPDTLGTEAVTNIGYYSFANDGTLVAYTIESAVVSTSLANLAVRFPHFDWHPHEYILDHGSDDLTQPIFDGVLSELQNYTVVSPGDLAKIHEMALMGMMRVPLMGTWDTNFTR